MATPYTVGSAAEATGFSSLTVPVSNTTAANDLIVLVIGSANSAATVASISDGHGTVYSKQVAVASGNQHEEHWSGIPTVSLVNGTDSYTINLNSASGQKMAVIRGLTGPTSATADKTNSANGTSTSPSSGSTGTLSQANEWVIGGIQNASGGGTPSSLSFGTGITVSSGAILTEFDEVVSSAAAQTASGTITSAAWGACISTYEIPSNVNVALTVAQVTVASPSPGIKAGPLSLGVATVAVSAPAPGIKSGPLALPVATVAIAAPAPSVTTGGTFVSLPVARVTIAAPAPSISGMGVALPVFNVGITAQPVGVQTGEKHLLVSIATNPGVDPVTGTDYPAGLFANEIQLTLDNFEITNAGAFYYSGEPGQGNLICSISAMDGSDQYGNVYPDGLTLFDANEYPIFQLSEQVGVFVAGIGGENTPQVVIDPGVGPDEVASLYFGMNSRYLLNNPAIYGDVGSNYYQLAIKGPQVGAEGAPPGGQVSTTYNSSNTSGTSSANLEFLYEDTVSGYHEYAYLDSSGFNILAGSIFATEPSTGTTSSPAVPETWHNFNPLSNSWFVPSGGFAKYRRTPMNELQISAVIQAPSSGVDNVTICNFPTGYRPASAHIFPVAAMLNGSEAPQMTLLTGGNMQAQGILASSVVAFEVKIPLDV